MDGRPNLHLWQPLVLILFLSSEPIILANRTEINQKGFASKMRFSVGSEARIYEGTTITVKCPVRNFKKSQIIWERGVTPLLPSNDTRIKVNQGGTLRIRHVRKNDSGVYACRAGSARETFTLRVKGMLGLCTVVTRSILNQVLEMVQKRLILHVLQKIMRRGNVALKAPPPCVSVCAVMQLCLTMGARSVNMEHKCFFYRLHARLLLLL